MLRCGAVKPLVEHGPGSMVGGRYRLVQILGEGGMGVVFEAVDEQLDRKVALKLIHPLSGGDDLVARLEREAHAAARLGHPNIVPVLDFGAGGDEVPYLVMQLLEGTPLRSALREGPMSIGRALDVHVQVLEGLAAAHDAGVIHRDLKPANIFLTPLGPGREIVRILDFGLAYLLEDGAKKLTQRGISLGTPAYMAPERIRGEAPTQACDLYSVGVCLYESLAGRRPFEDANPAILQGRALLFDAPDITTLCDDLPEGVPETIRRSLAKEPSERFDSAVEMRDALLAVRDALDAAERMRVAATRADAASEEADTREVAVAAAPDADPGATKRLGSMEAPGAVPKVSAAATIRDAGPPPGAIAPPAAVEAATPPTRASIDPGPVRAPKGSPTELPTVVRKPFWRPFAGALVAVFGVGVALIGGLIYLEMEPDPPPPSASPAPEAEPPPPAESVAAEPEPEPLPVAVPAPLPVTREPLVDEPADEPVREPEPRRGRGAPRVRPLPEPVVETAPSAGRRGGASAPGTEVLEPEW